MASTNPLSAAGPVLLVVREVYRNYECMNKANKYCLQLIEGYQLLNLRYACFVLLFERKECLLSLLSEKPLLLSFAFLSYTVTREEASSFFVSLSVGVRAGELACVGVMFVCVSHFPCRDSR